MENKQTFSPTDHVPVGMSASQLGLNQPHKKSRWDKWSLIKKGLSLLICAQFIFISLVLLNVVTLKEFKPVSYKNSQGSNFTFDFYTKHGSKELRSGNKELVSKVPKDGKFPLTISISDTNVNGYNQFKVCSTGREVFSAVNDHIKQKIAVCDLLANREYRGQSVSGLVYAATFTYGKKYYAVTMSQDYSSIDLTNPAQAKQSLTRFNMDPYKEDIKRIVSSIEVK